MLDGKGPRPAGHSVTLREYEDVRAFARGCNAMIEASSDIDEFDDVIGRADENSEGLAAPSAALPPLP
jgi:hypothetical protein